MAQKKISFSEAAVLISHGHHVDLTQFAPLEIELLSGRKDDKLNEKMIAKKKIGFDEAAVLIKYGHHFDLTQLSCDINYENQEFYSTYLDPEACSGENDGQTPIYKTSTLTHIAIKSNNINALRDLLEKGADLNISSKLIYANSTKIEEFKKSEDLAKKNNNPGILFEILKYKEKRLAEQNLSAAEVGLRTLKLYAFGNVQQAQQAEYSFQTYVNDKFFQRNKFKKPLKANGHADLLVTQIENILKLKVQSKIRDSALKKIDFNDSEQTKIVKFYVDHAIVLDGSSSRSVILALTHILNEYHYIPTLVFKIGAHHILCVENSTKNQKGNVNIQAVKADGKYEFIPSVYGDGNGKSQNSIATQLNPIIVKKADVFSLMKAKM